MYVSRVTQRLSKVHKVYEHLCAGSWGGLSVNNKRKLFTLPKGARRAIMDALRATGVRVEVSPNGKEADRFAAEVCVLEGFDGILGEWSSSSTPPLVL